MRGNDMIAAGVRGRIPAWLSLSLLTVVLWGCWGLQAKLITDRISPWMNQVLFSLGLLPVVGWMLVSKRVHAGSDKKRGGYWAFFTGILGGVGNIAFYLALVRGGSVAVVVPLTCLFPLVTVVAAYFGLKEKLTRPQCAGLALALVAIYLLST
jgi:transporter family protein